MNITCADGEERTLTAAVDGQSIEVSGPLPQDAELQVVAVPLKDAAAIYENETGEATGAKEIVFAYDITILSSGEKYDPEDFGESVAVAIRNVEAENGVNVLHVKADVADLIDSLEGDRCALVFDPKSVHVL